MTDSAIFDDEAGAQGPGDVSLDPQGDVMADQDAMLPEGGVPAGVEKDAILPDVPPQTSSLSANNVPEGWTLIEDAPRAEIPEGWVLVEDAPLDEAASIGEKVKSRFLGTDVDDPMELERIGSIIAFGLTGSYILGKSGVIAGTAMGGPAGGAVLGAVGTVVGGLGGTVAGTIAPEATLEALELAGVLEPGTREDVGLSPSELATLVEGEVLLEIATVGGLSAVRQTGRVVSHIVTRSGPEAARTAERAALQKIALMPVQVGSSRIARGYVAVMGRFPFIGGPVKKGGEKAEEGLRAAFEGLPYRVAPISTWSDVSETIYRDGRNLSAATGRYFDEKYTALFARADESGVWVVPRETLVKADEILKQIALETPAVFGKQGDPGKTTAIVKKFIEENILLMRRSTDEATAFANQSLRQMDGVISKIDEELAALDPGSAKYARSLMNQLRQAAQLDAVANLRGQNSGEIARSMRELDTEFSTTMSEIFETATAKAFMTVQRKGIRGMSRDEAMRTPVDQMSRLVVKLESPQAIDELSRLVTPETFDRVVGQVLEDAVTKSMVTASGDGVRFDVDAFAKSLGLDSPSGNKRKSVAAMLQKSGSGLTIETLDDLVATSRAVSSVEIPNVSTFIARRAGIGGIRGVIHGVLPGIAVAGGGYAVGGLVGMATMVGGGRLVSSILANPDSARSILKIADKEASRVVKRQAYVRLLRLGIASMESEGSMTGQAAAMLETLLPEIMDAYDAQVDQIGGAFSQVTGIPVE